uniref:Uncharacterized protein n=1 Tax=Rhizophora mucronata TaxID=61149 RepID=A0A2P2PKY8_RHIMU
MPAIMMQSHSQPSTSWDQVLRGICENSNYQIGRSLYRSTTSRLSFQLHHRQ